MSLLHLNLKALREYQENALGSWTRLVPRPEIILFCDDPGVAEAAEKFGCVHVPDIRCNEKNIPYVSHAFHLASQLATNDILCFANTDVIFIQDFVAAVDVVTRNFDQPFLIVGQRWNVSMPEPLEFTDGWQRQLWDRVRRENDLRAATAIDYFIYPRGAIADMPDFLVGSPKWDNWTVGDAEKRGLQVISATKAITCIHQRHRHVWPAEGTAYNKRLFKESSGRVGFAHSGSWVLSSGATLRPARGQAKTSPGRVAAGSKHSHKSPRPARVIPRDELGLPINLNIPARELVSSAKRLRRQATGKTPARKKHSHSGPPERERLLAERAKARQARDTIQATRVAARDARLLQRKRGKP